MPGNEAPKKIHTLPFIPPVFDWSAQNLYIQFRIFKTKVQFAFDGMYRSNSNDANIGAILNWMGHVKCTITLYGICLLTITTLERFSLNLKITLSQPKMSIIAGICSEGYIPHSSNLRVIS